MNSSNYAFSVDVEDWYQGLELPLIKWKDKPNRLDLGLNVILEILEEKNIKATFFTLGVVARDNPKSLELITRNGHEIASHSMFHEKIYQLKPAEFLKQERECKNLLEQISQTTIVGFRAPFFSITKKSLWALDILSELGYTYDSSISPVQTWRYGISGIRPGIYRLKSGLIEFTPSIGHLYSHTYGLGGAFFRIYPYVLTKSAFTQIGISGFPGMFYIHPWEFDTSHPKIRLPLRPFLTHYSRLGSTKSKTKRLINDFTFLTVSELIQIEVSRNNVGNLDLSEYDEA